MSIEKIERALRSDLKLTDGRYLGHCSAENIQSLLDEISRLRRALDLIAGLDPVEAALDPGWAARSASHALGRKVSA